MLYVCVVIIKILCLLQYWVKVPVVSPRLMTTDVEEDDERLSRSVHKFLARLANHVFLSLS